MEYQKEMMGDEDEQSEYDSEYDDEEEGDDKDGEGDKDLDANEQAMLLAAVEESLMEKEI